jgi:hypothetical protein
MGKILVSFIFGILSYAALIISGFCIGHNSPWAFVFWLTAGTGLNMLEIYFRFIKKST